MPKVSVIIPTYNNLEGIKRVISSVLSQKYDDYEVIVTDDSSNNEIELYLSEINNSKIKYFKNEVALGSPENWNEGLRRATGEYIKLIHHDDWFATDDALEKLVNLMDENKDCDFGYAKSVNVQVDTNKKKHRHAEKYVKKIEKNPLVLLESNRIGAPSVCIFKNGLNFFFDKNLKWLVDIDFYITVLQKNPHIAFIKEELINIGIQGYRMTDYCLENEDLIIKEQQYVENKFLPEISKTKKKFFFKNKKKDSILVINTGYLGDVVVTSKLIRDLKEHFKKNIVFLVDKPYKKLAEQIPNVDDVIIINRKNFKNIFGLSMFIIVNKLKYKFDYAFIVFRYKKWHYIISKILGIKNIKNMVYELSDELKEIVKSDEKYTLVHYQAANMLATITNKLSDDRDIELNVSKESQEKIDNEIKKQNLTNLVAINPQASDDWKTWDINELKEFMKWLILNNYTPVLTGLSKDGREYINTLEQSDIEKKWINLYDKTDFEELSAWYKRCKALISVDTGSSHIGIGVGTPTIVLFFKDWARLWHPINLEKNTYIEKEKISAQEVIEQFKNIVEKN